MKKLIAIFAVLGVLMAAARCYIVRYFVEPETGFFIGGAPVVIFCALLVVLPLLAIAVFFKSSTYRKTTPRTGDFFGGGFPQMAVISLAAVVFLVDAVVETYIAIYRPNMSEQSFFGAVLALLCAVYFFLELPACRSAKLSGKMALFSLMPVLWIGARLIMAFIKYTARATIMENTLDTISTVFLLLYFFAKSKCMAGINATRSLFGFGTCALFFVSVFSLPRLVFSLSSSPEFSAAYIGQFAVKDALFICLLPYIIFSMLKLDDNLSHKSLRLADLPPPPPPEGVDGGYRYGADDAPAPGADDAAPQAPSGSDGAAP